MYINGERSLAWVAKIDNVIKHPNADALDIVRIGGWNVVAKLGEFNVGDLCVYFSIDAWVPDAIAPWLSKGKVPRVFNGIAGDRLRSIKLRGELSQGLAMSMDAIRPHLVPVIGESYFGILTEGDDLTELLKVQKWEAAIPANLAGQMEGGFPSYIRKTDEERCQNMVADISRFAEEGLHFEMTEKLDGSSTTIFLNDGKFGICSRNWELRETPESTQWSLARKLNIEEGLHEIGRNIALQMEIIGEGIQKNRYAIKGQQFYVFKIWDIDRQTFVPSAERLEIASKLGLNHAPVLGVGQLIDGDIDKLLAFAEGKSILNENTEREGIVFKCIEHPEVSFKCISNLYLLKIGE